MHQVGLQLSFEMSEVRRSMMRRMRMRNAVLLSRSSSCLLPDWHVWWSLEFTFVVEHVCVCVQ